MRAGEKFVTTLSQNNKLTVKWEVLARLKLNYCLS